MPYKNGQSSTKYRLLQMMKECIVTFAMSCNVLWWDICTVLCLFVWLLTFLSLSSSLLWSVWSYFYNALQIPTLLWGLRLQIPSLLYVFTPKAIINWLIKKILAHYTYLLVPNDFTLTSTPYAPFPVTVRLFRFTPITPMCFWLQYINIRQIITVHQ